MTLTSPPGSVDTAAPTKGHRTGRWIKDWRPEDKEFWTETGAPIAKRNLIWSIFAEHLGFSVWLIWSVSSAFLLAMGFQFSVEQLFFLVAIPNLVGSLLRVPYTLAVPKFGGRNWTMVSAALLLVPTLGFAYAVTNPDTPYWAFCLIAATAGFGGGNFASSMANINFFYPADKKGAALGLNAAGGNLGVSLIQFFLPIIVGGAGIFGLVKASEGGIHLERAAWVYAGLAVAATVAAYFFMDNLESAKSNPREQLSVLKEKQTWIMSFLYIGTFGSFIGYSAAMPLLIKVNFWRQPLPSITGIGINFAFYAFLGALVGSMARPLGGYLADKYGGARITLFAFCGMILSTLTVLFTLSKLTVLPPPPAPDAVAEIAKDPAGFQFPEAVVTAIDANKDVFPWFLAAFLMVFVFSGIGNGSTYKMIPAIFRKDALRDTDPDSPERELALHSQAKKASAAIGIIGAVGAIGGFLIPITFNSPWVTEPLAATKNAFWIFTAFYVVCAIVTWAVYIRKRKGANADAGYVGV
ncbi:nitrate/nitrite transporter [Nocardioides bizhenqiangii]|uniref:Nitrate/nitrite transporter n=1 Tax=Nocardioides bizhenqiangii TaxID=3095076 RepID=A0ABZ0ZTG7_9ACTN|nr:MULTISPECIES: nitrate/nitrite transporter [unclassified Nocardioides]MDZ5622543.1 nitrate/nitrite transporter [Nocardioides sp. HM23]WQQ26798.1 nitrate/nitrite transporter [Nocardioides sp. HM61]